MKLGRAFKKESKRRKKLWKKKNKKIKKALDEAMDMLSFAIDEVDVKLTSVMAVVQRAERDDTDARSIHSDSRSDAASTATIQSFQNAQLREQMQELEKRNYEMQQQKLEWERKEMERAQKEKMNAMEDMFKQKMRERELEMEREQERRREDERRRRDSSDFQNKRRGGCCGGDGCVLS